MAGSQDLYSNRALSQGYPEMDGLAHRKFSDTVKKRPDDTARIEWLLTLLGRLVDLNGSRRMLLLGCGPHPQPAKLLSEHGHTVVAIDPVISFVATAQTYLGSAAEVLEGAAESIPLPDASQDVVVFESVLEHVDSVRRSLEEIHRVLAPGGVLYLTTTCRHRFSLRGFNGEYNVRFFNWFPRLVREGYILEHLHYRPHLANYTRRPAVHWFSFAELCARGRDAGFAQFYSRLDLMRATDPVVARSRVRRLLFSRIQHDPWVRALALTQLGGMIFMLKRDGSRESS